MTGNGTEAKPYLISTYEDWLSYLTDFSESSTFNGENPAYYKLVNDIECRKYIWKNQDVCIEYATAYTKILDGCGYSIKNFFSNLSTLASLKGDDSTFKIYNTVIDSCILKDSVFGQGFTHDFGVFYFNECSISLGLVGSNLITDTQGYVGKYTDTGIGAGDIQRFNNRCLCDSENKWNYCYQGAVHTRCYGSSMLFDNCAVTIKYYPEKYWYNTLDNMKSENGKGILKNMMRMFQFKNSKAKIYMTNSLKCVDGYYLSCGNSNYSSRNCPWNASFGISITDYSDIEFYIEGLLYLPFNNYYGSANGVVLGSNYNYYRNICWFSELNDSVVKFYPNKIGLEAVNNNLTNIEINPGNLKITYNQSSGYNAYPVLNVSANTTGKNVVYIENPWTWDSNSLGLGFYKNTESQNVVLTTNYNNIKDDKWLIDNGIVCMNTKLTDKTGD